MTGRTYRLKTPTLAILTLDDGHRIPITIPQGGTVHVSAVDLDSNLLANVSWEGKTVMMFIIDLRDRGEVVGSTNA